MNKNDIIYTTSNGIMNFMEGHTVLPEFLLVVNFKCGNRKILTNLLQTIKQGTQQGYHLEAIKDE